MRVNVKLFAVLRERAGVSGFDLELPEGAAVSAAREAIAARYPAAAPMLGRAAFAVNREYVREDALLRDGDEVAVIPPVSGG